MKEIQVQSINLIWDQKTNNYWKTVVDAEKEGGLVANKILKSFKR